MTARGSGMSPPPVWARERGWLVRYDNGFPVFDVAPAGCSAPGRPYNSATTVTATAVNDNPVISGVVASQAITDAATAAPLSNVTISDVDFGQTETVTVILSNPGNGVLSNLAAGSYDTSSGV